MDYSAYGYPQAYPQTAQPTAPPAPAKEDSSKKLILIAIAVVCVVLLLMVMMRKPAEKKEELPTDPNDQTQTGAKVTVGKIQATGVTDRCLRVENGYDLIGKEQANYSKVSGAHVTTWSCNDGETSDIEESWGVNTNKTLEWIPQGKASGMCWTQGSDNAGTFTTLQPCTAATNQIYNVSWPLIKDADNKNCLDLRGASSKNQVQVGPWPCNGSSNQDFAFKPM